MAGLFGSPTYTTAQQNTMRNTPLLGFQPPKPAAPAPVARPQTAAPVQQQPPPQQSYAPPQPSGGYNPGSYEPSGFENTQPPPAYGGGGGGYTPSAEPPPAAMEGLSSALPTMGPVDEGNSIYNVGNPSAANPMLGKRNPAMEGLSLALQKPRNY